MDTLKLEPSPVITCGNILIIIIKIVRGKTARCVCSCVNLLDHFSYKAMESAPGWRKAKW